MAHPQPAVSSTRPQAGMIVGAAVSAAVCFGLSAAADPAEASDAGRITGDAINRPGVALPLDRQGARSVTAPSAPAGKAAGTPPEVKMTKEPSLFSHPVRGFQLPIPAGVAVAHRGEEMHVAVRSPRGYVMNTQTGDANPTVPLPNMLARLETRYLGERGPWQRKLGSAETVLTGLPAIDAMYQGHRTRTRVVIARGRKTDFVFTFTAPLDLYADQERNFDWVLGNFVPGPGERPAETPIAENGGNGQDKAMPRVPVRAGGTVDSFAAGRPAPNRTATPAPDMHRFTDPGYGFLIDYPKEWEVTKPTAFSASFSGPEGQASHDAVVSVQNVNPAGALSSEESATIATADLLKALDRGTQHLTVLGEGKLSESPGSQFIARYDYSGTTYRKWAVVVPRPDGKIAHVWSFTAPDAAFDDFRPVAESMLRSWTLTQ